MGYRITRRYLLLLLVVLFQSAAYAQYVLTEATNAYNLYQFDAAKHLFTKAYKKKQTAAAARGAADSYRLTKDYLESEKWYAALWQLKNVTSQDELHYAGVLMTNSKYAEAAVLLKTYLAKVPTDIRAANMLSGCDAAGNWISHPNAGHLENMEALNSSYADWSVAYQHNTFIFASDRPYKGLRKQPFFENDYLSKRMYSWTGNSYLHLYQSDGTDSNSTKLLEREWVNGDYHSASASYTRDGSKMYFSVTTLIKKPGSLLGKDSIYTINIAVKELQQDSLQKWVRTPVLPFNAVLRYSVGDPWINAGGDTLYFVSGEGPGHRGGTDIYYAVKKDNQWESPVNLGNTINTEGNERTPYFDEDGHFYFASDGHPGLGGLDIFRASIGSNHTWTITNAGTPVNSPYDDFAPAVIKEVLYLSSNRLSGKGSDDIYRFTPTYVPPPVVVRLPELEGFVWNKADHLPLPAVNITLKNSTTGIEISTTTDDKGHYFVMLDSLSNYKMSIRKPGYTCVTDIDVTTVDIIPSALVKKDLEMEKTVLGEPIKIENIYFDLGKSAIRPDAAKELDKLVKLLTDNPTWDIEIGAHTDSRAPDTFNMALSKRRAESTVAYLAKSGIDISRLKAKGYGETKPVNKCTNGVPCSEAEHLLNRRTEFIILRQ